MNWSTVVRRVLPPGWPRWIAVATVPAVAGVYQFSSSLPEAYLPSSATEAFLIRLLLSLATALVGALSVLGFTVLAYNKAQRPETKEREPHERNSPICADDIFRNVLALVAKYHSQEIPATPTRIAHDLGLDPNIMLDHMYKYHNDQFITFRNAGKPPQVDTPFFLSEKALNHIKFVVA